MKVILALAGDSLSAPTFTVSDDKGDTYAAVSGTRVTDASNHGVIELFQANRVGSGARTITATASVGATLSIAAGEWTSSDAATRTEVATAATGSGTGPDPGSVTSGANVDMIVSAVGDRRLSAAQTQTLTIPTSWVTVFTARSNGSATLSIGLARRAITGGSAIDGPWGDSPSVTWMANVASFNAGSGGGGGALNKGDGIMWEPAYGGWGMGW